MEQDSWKRLSEALEFYASRGFEYKDVPWAVEPCYTALTMPEGGEDFPLRDKALVGSAEQSFLSKYLTLDKDKIYYGLTPCFRKEQEIDYWHQDYFMKVELFSSNPANNLKIMKAAASFFYTIVPKWDLQVEWEEGEVSCDILYNGIELGSYYTRDLGDYKWACGTGLAEPRFTKALKWNQEKQQA